MQKTNRSKVTLIVGIVIALIVYSMLVSLVEVAVYKSYISRTQEVRQETLQRTEDLKTLSYYRGKVEQLNDLYVSKKIENDDALLELHEIIDEVNKKYPEFKEEVLGELFKEETDFSKDFDYMQSIVEGQLWYNIELASSK